MKITFKVEITEKELAAALLPLGGKITDVEVAATTTRSRRVTAPTTQKKTVKKTATTEKKKTVPKAKATI